MNTILKGNFRLVRVVPNTYFDIMEGRTNHIVFEFDPPFEEDQGLIIIPFNSFARRELNLPILKKQVSKIDKNLDVFECPQWTIHLKDLE